MGRAGRAPAPTVLRRLRGDDKYRINENEPQPTNGLCAEPDWLSPYALEEWQRVERDVIAMNVGKPVDSTALSAWCEAVARFRTATEALTQFGMFYFDSDNHYVKNPAVIVARDASSDMLRWAREFGFTPSSRQTLKTQNALDAPGTMHQLLSG
jgi:P27 family predicted phage terminase small subunit